MGTHTVQMTPEQVWMWEWADIFYHFKNDVIVIFKFFSVIKMYCCHLLCKKTVMLISIKLGVVKENNVISSKFALN